MVNGIKERIALIRAEIREAAEKCGRNPGDIKLMGVSKYHPLDKMLEASGYVELLGENKVQEAADKKASWPEENKTPLHLIGHLQRNKARKALEIFDLIESVDSPELALTLNRILGETGRTGYPVYAEINMSGEESKSGAAPESASELIRTIIKECPHLVLEGLMTIATHTDNEEDIRKSFISLRELRDKTEAEYEISIPELSMGMSGDYRIAIEEGSTIVRIGTAIFGAREYN